LLSLLAVICLQLLGAPARAQISCSVSFSALAFGSVDVLPGTAADSAGLLNTACSGAGFTGSITVLLCFRMDNGSYPTSGGLRQMGAGANRLGYQIYKDAARTTIWDSSSTGQYAVLLTPGSPSASLPTYGRVAGGQQIVPPGTYSSTITISIGGAAYNGTPPLTNCPSLGVIGTRTFVVSATVVSACLVSVSNMNFGSTSFFNSNIDATSSVFVTCTNGTPYNVRLNGGTTGATNPALRKMSLGANQITYGLYRNAARTLGWGDLDGTNTAPGTGTASSATHTVYGRIPPQASVPPGVYTDTVIAVVSY
jgi:spore coat protein U-like protein